MIKIDDISLLKLLPNFLQEDKEIQFLTQVIQEEMDLINTREKNLFLYGNFSSLNEPILDELAYQWKVEGYDQTLSKDIKADLVETAYIVRKTKGTRYAVETTIKDIHGDFELLEWYQYGGDPYHFKVVGETAPTGEKLEKLYKSINTTKNERSSLDGIIVSSQWEGINYHSTLYHSSIFEEIPLDPNVASDFEEYLGGING
ncbi:MULTISPECIES: phage tail protein I [Psychrilyobacter]|nr:MULTISPECIES: phage tail protein I [Psychrilyobacter]MCS5421240.1 phage tail protein I [Psychrilyobacter sp. S5]NDI77003.1 phage tail protein I [Psychrilyobacter piezotolerans]